jgi:hypothetical protein
MYTSNKQQISNCSELKTLMTFNFVKMKGKFFTTTKWRLAYTSYILFTNVP